MDFKEYKRRFKARKTSTLVKGYHGFTEEYRRAAREEFKRRKVATSRLPYKKRRTDKRARSIFGLRQIPKSWLRV